jgi:hypothetical protein
MIKCNLKIIDLLSPSLKEVFRKTKKQFSQEIERTGDRNQTYSVKINCYFLCNGCVDIFDMLVCKSVKILLSFSLKRK